MITGFIVVVVVVVGAGAIVVEVVASVVVVGGSGGGNVSGNVVDDVFEVVVEPCGVVASATPVHALTANTGPSTKPLRRTNLLLPTTNGHVHTAKAVSPTATI